MQTISKLLSSNYYFKFFIFPVTTDAALIELDHVEIEVCSCENEPSEICRVATMNGFITVCTSDLLLAAVEWKNTEDGLVRTSINIAPERTQLTR